MRALLTNEKSSSEMILISMPDFWHMTDTMIGKNLWRIPNHATCSMATLINEISSAS